MRGLAIIAALAIAGMADARTMKVPQGCTATATVHKTSCAVTTIMQCGDRVRQDTYVHGRLEDTHVFGPNWDLIEYFADGNKMHVSFEEDATPEVNLDELLNAGISEGVRVGQFSTKIVKNRKMIMRSRIGLDGNKIEIDGVQFQTGHVRRYFEVENIKGGTTWKFDVFLSGAPKLFIEGNLERRAHGDELHTFEWTPKSISWPGERGFLAIKSDHGC